MKIATATSILLMIVAEVISSERHQHKRSVPVPHRASINDVLDKVSFILNKMDKSCCSENIFGDLFPLTSEGDVYDSNTSRIREPHTWIQHTETAVVITTEQPAATPQGTADLGSGSTEDGWQSWGISSIWDEAIQHIAWFMGSDGDDDGSGENTSSVVGSPELRPLLYAPGTKLNDTDWSWFEKVQSVLRLPEHNSSDNDGKVIGKGLSALAGLLPGDLDGAGLDIAMLGTVLRCNVGSYISELRPMALLNSDNSLTILSYTVTCENANDNESSNIGLTDVGYTTDQALVRLASQLAPVSVLKCPPSTYMAAYYVDEMSTEFTAGLPLIHVGCRALKGGPVVPSLGSTYAGKKGWTSSCFIMETFCELKEVSSSMSSNVLDKVELVCCSHPLK